MLKRLFRDSAVRTPNFHLLRITRAVVIDLLVIILAHFLTFVLHTLTMPIDSTHALAFTFMSMFATVIVFYLIGVYHRIWERTTSGHGTSIIIAGLAIAALIAGILDLLLFSQQFPVTVFFMANTLAFAGFVGVRYRSRLVSGLIWRWRAVFYHEFPTEEVTARVNTLIIGAGESGQTLAWRVQHRFPGNQYKLIGFVDDDSTKQGLYVEGVPVLGNRYDIPRLVEKHDISLIIVAIHNISGRDFREILEKCESTPARIKVVPDVFAIIKSLHNPSFLRDVQPEDLLGRRLITRHEAVNLTPVTRKTVLVTGGAGSIGSELSRQLASYEPVKLVLVDTNESGLHDMQMELRMSHPDLNLVVALVDITNREALERLYQDHRPQVVFHAAAYKHVPMMEWYPEQAVRTNIGGTRNLAELAQQYDVERFVLISTDKAVNPSSVMGASKRICELMVQALSQKPENKTLFTAVRFGNVLGSRGSVVPIFNSQINRGGPVTITHPEMTRYFMSIPEAANLVIHAGCLTEGNEIFLLKMGEVVKIVDLAERIIRMRGMRPGIDIEIKFTGMRPGEKMHEQLYDGAAEDAFETMHPGIIKLVNHYDHQLSELFPWVDRLLESGVPRENPLQALLWGMTSSEEEAYAVQH